MPGFLRLLDVVRLVLLNSLFPLSLTNVNLLSNFVRLTENKCISCHNAVYVCENNGISEATDSHSAVRLIVAFGAIFYF